MAIYSSVPPPNQQPQSQSGIDIESWTLHALQHLDIAPLLSSSPSNANHPPLQIPIHDTPLLTPSAATAAAAASTAAKRHTTPSKPKLHPSPTTSKRRDLAEKGKEGSRRRQRWENDRLIGVPGVVAPSASDWAIGSTSPVRMVPYYLAPLWDGSSGTRRGGEAGGEREERGRVPGDLRERIRKGKVEGELLRRLEGEVRRFVVEWEMMASLSAAAATARAVPVPGSTTADAQEKANTVAPDEKEESSDEEIVFVGRDLSARTIRLGEEEKKSAAAAAARVETERCVFEARVGDRGGALGRYLVHALAGYYGLRSWSVTVGGGRRALVGIRERAGEVPRPLYAVV